MPQEFNVLSCFSCKTFQVDQVKKSTNKWSCKICHEKQSIKQIFFKGTGKECRLWAQESNMRKAMMQNDIIAQQMNIQIHTKQYNQESVIDACKEESKIIVQDKVGVENNKWKIFLQDKNKDEHDVADGDVDPFDAIRERANYESNRKPRQEVDNRKSKSSRYKPYFSNETMNSLTDRNRISQNNPKHGSQETNYSIQATLGKYASKDPQSVATTMFDNTELVKENEEHLKSNPVITSKKIIIAKDPNSKPVVSKWTQYLAINNESEDDIE